MDFWGVAVGALIGSAAWIYQRVWEHQEKRVLRYRELVDRLPAFTVTGLDPKLMDEAMMECRRLWLSAPDDRRIDHIPTFVIFRFGVGHLFPLPARRRSLAGRRILFTRATRTSAIVRPHLRTVAGFSFFLAICRQSITITA